MLIQAFQALGKDQDIHAKCREAAYYVINVALLKKQSQKRSSPALTALPWLVLVNRTISQNTHITQGHCHMCSKTDRIEDNPTMLSKHKSQVTMETFLPPANKTAGLALRR